MNLKKFILPTVFLSSFFMLGGSINAMSPVYKNKITGSIFYDSDTPDVEDLIYTAGQVLAICAERWPDFCKALRKEHGSSECIHASNLQFPLSHELFKQYVEVSAKVDAHGVYAFKLEPGQYVFCAANLGSLPSEPDRYRASINGCAIDVVITGHTRTLNFQFGELGFSVLPMKE